MGEILALVSVAAFVMMVLGLISPATFLFGKTETWAKAFAVYGLPSFLLIGSAAVL